MVGFYSGDPFDSAAEREQGSDLIPSTLGEAVGSEFTGAVEASPSMRITRAIQRTADANPGMPFTEGDTSQGFDLGQLQAPPSRTLDSDEANRTYGIPGVLSFDQPVSEPVARDLYQARHADVVRQDIQDRAPGSFAVRTGASVAGSLLDPLNLAAGLIPGVGEGRFAALLGDGALARVGARAASGFTAGAAGMAAMEPLNYALDQGELRDWTLGQALRDVAFGGVIGGGLHTLLGGFARAPVQDVSARIEAAGPEAREAMLQGALGQVAGDRPVSVAPALDAFEAERWAELTRADPRGAVWEQARQDASARLSVAQSELDDMIAGREARNRGEAPESMAGYETPAAVDSAVRAKEAAVAALRGRLALAEHATETLGQGGDVPFLARYADPALNRRVTLESPGRTPQTMLARIRELGGLQDQGGELSARDLHLTPGMVRQSGMGLEDAAVRMADEGYLPDLKRDMELNEGAPQVDRVGALLDAADEERAGRPRIAEQDVPAWDAAVSRHEAARDRLRQVAEHLGISEVEARGLRRGQVEDILRERGSLEDAAAAAADREGFGDAEAERELNSDEFKSMTPDELDQRHAQSIDDLVAQLDREDAATTATREAAEKAVTTGPRDLAALQQEVADLEAGMKPPPLDAEGKPTEVSDSALDAANGLAEQAEARARALEQAAACLRRAGA